MTTKQPASAPPATPLVYRHWREGMDPEECVSVDGNAPGRINLSHWPGNRTPIYFRHDLSTGSVLLLNQYSGRAGVLEGITTVTNNHWDTDGLCSAWALIEPEKALKHQQTLLAAAMAGDFEMFTTPEGVKIDLTLTALTKNPNSPVFTGKFGTDLECREAQYAHGLELLPRLLENPDLHADWFAREYWTIQKDMRAIREEEAQVQELTGNASVTFVASDRLLHRAAVNTIVQGDRIITCVPVEGGWLYELRLSTRSWFQLQSRPWARRPDWTPLLQELAGMAAGQEGKWVAQDHRDPAPTMKFVDARGNLVPCATEPEEVGASINAFYCKYPLLEPLAAKPARG